MKERRHALQCNNTDHNSKQKTHKNSAHTHALTHALTHSFNQLNKSINQSLPPSLTHLVNLSFIQSINHSHLLTHSRTHTYTPETPKPTHNNGRKKLTGAFGAVAPTPRCGPSRRRAPAWRLPPAASGSNDRAPTLTAAQTDTTRPLPPRSQLGTGGFYRTGQMEGTKEGRHSA